MDSNQPLETNGILIMLAGHNGDDVSVVGGAKAAFLGIFANLIRGASWRSTGLLVSHPAD
jgi:hypothetical protein